MEAPCPIVDQGLFWASLCLLSRLGKIEAVFRMGVLYLARSRPGDTSNLGGLFLEYKWVVLTVTTVGIFMATLDSSILVVGLPQVVFALKTNLVVGVWFITIYRLMITILLVGIGRLADLHGRVRLYNLGFAIFTVGSLLSGLSITAEELLGFRPVQGVGAALLLVTIVAMVSVAFS